MITIDFSIYYKDPNFDDIFNFLKREFKALTRFEDFGTLLYSDLIEFKNNQTDIYLTDQQIESIGFKIEKNENLFYRIYSNYEKLKTYNTDEKLLISVNKLQDLLAKTNEHDFTKFMMQMQFLNDFKEYLIFENNKNEINNNKSSENQYLHEITEFTKLFKNQAYTFFSPQKLSDYNLIYTYRNDEIKLKNENSKSDLTLLLVVLESEKITNKVKKRIWNEIMTKCINDTVDESFFSQKLTDYKNGSVTNMEDEERILNIKSFLKEMLKSTKI